MLTTHIFQMSGTRELYRAWTYFQDQRFCYFLNYDSTDGQGARLSAFLAYKRKPIQMQTRVWTALKPPPTKKNKNPEKKKKTSPHPLFKCRSWAKMKDVIIIIEDQDRLIEVIFSQPQNTTELTTGLPCEDLAYARQV